VVGIATVRIVGLGRIGVWRWVIDRSRVYYPHGAIARNGVFPVQAHHVRREAVKFIDELKRAVQNCGDPGSTEERHFAVKQTLGTMRMGPLNEAA